MSNSLSATGATRLSWTLTATQTVGSVKREAESRVARTITNGTGVNQANVGYAQTHTVTGGTTVDLDLTGITHNAFGSTGVVAFTTVKEVLMVVGSATGVNVLIGGITGTTGTKVNEGGMYHLCDYAVGLAASNWSGSTIRIGNPTTVPINVDVSLIGVGTFSS